MRLRGLVVRIGAPLLLATIVVTQALPPTHLVGETYELVRVPDSTQKGSTGSSGSAHDVDTIIERTVRIRADGLELEYDLPKSASTDERARSWQFPARILKLSSGEVRLLNEAELEMRRDAWLKAARLRRDACGHWIFTWNAFRIECDPQSVIGAIQAFDLTSLQLSDGGLYQDGEARGSGGVVRKEARPDGATFTVEMQVDSEGLNRRRAESDVVVGEIVHKPIALDAALRERAADAVTGTIMIEFETDAAGNVYRRSRVTTIVTKKPSGQSETETVTETLERLPARDSSG